MNEIQNQRELTVKIYTPESPLKKPIQFIADIFKDAGRSRELAWRLAVRDISAQYRQAALGLLWAFLLPIINTATWIFLQGTGIVAIGDTALPYPVYVFTGTMLWAIFTEAFNAPLQVSIAAKPMLSKINFPREALLFSGILQTLFNGLIKVLILIIALSLLGFYPGWYLLLFPLAFFSLILAGTALGLLLTPVGLLYSDIGKAIPLIMQFLMYLTPVVFPMPDDGLAATLFKWNPLTPLVLTARGWLTNMPSEFMTGFVLVTGIMVVLIFLVWSIYKLALPILIERMNA